MEKGRTIAVALRALSSHPDLEDLMARAEGRLAAPADQARVEEHVADCTACADRCAEIASFLAEPEVGETPWIDGAEIWRGLVAKGISRRPPSVSPSREPRPGLHEPRLLQFLAGGVLLAAVLSSGAWWVAHRRLALLEGGELNVPIVEIDAGFRRQAEPGKEREPQAVPPGAVLIFTPLKEATGRGYEVRISTADGRHLVWSGQGLRPTPNGSFHFRLPRNLEPGETYRVRIIPGEGQELTIRVLAAGQE